MMLSPQDLERIDNEKNLSEKSHFVKNKKTGNTIVYSRWNPDWWPNSKVIKEFKWDIDKTLFSQEFEKSKIYLPEETELSFKEILNLTWEYSKRSNLILSMVWYSSLKNQLELWWVTTEQYEKFSTEIYKYIIEKIKNEFPKLNLLSIDGASDMWIDRALIETRKEHNLSWMSFSCPEYIRYVKDSGSAILISESADSYFKRFSMASDIMMVLWWRDAAFRKNYLVLQNSFSEQKISPAADPISSLSSNSNLDYFRKNYPDEDLILNASKAINHKSSIPKIEDIETIKMRFFNEIKEYIINSWKFNIN